ncbi:MAG TPA: hypothetical protein DCS93_41725 [Microscillaceae bacterium]|nr:hypothetical protein [Microscillaceae bacterium]
MNLYKLFTIPWLILILTHFVQAQSPKLWFDFYNRKLSNNHINQVIQDKTGFIWIATNKGLDRYDAYQFKQYKDLIKGKVNCLATQGEKVFVGTDNGLFALDIRFNILEKYDVSNKLNSNTIKCIHIDALNSLWVGTNKGLNTIDLKTKKVRSYLINENPFNKPENNITSIINDKDGALFIGTKSGLFIFNRNSKKFYSLQVASNQGVCCLYRSTKNTLYFATDDKKIYKKLDNQVDFQEIKLNTESYDKITSICSGGNRNIFIGTNNGLLILDSQTQKLQRYSTNAAYKPVSLNNEKITSLYKDRDEAIWIGTEQGGLNKLDYRRKKFESLYIRDNQCSSSPFYIRSIFEDNQNNVWVGTQGAGLFKFNAKMQKVRSFLPADSLDVNDNNKNNIRAIYQESEDSFLIGTYGNGLFRLKNEVFQKIELNITEKVKEIYCISESLENNEIYLGTDVGFITFKENTNQAQIYKPFSNPTDPKLNRVNFIKIDSDKNVWLATKGSGLMKFNPEKRKLINYPRNGKKLSSENTIHIYENQEGNLWIATYDNGLSFYNPETNHCIFFNKENSSIPDNRIYSVVEEDNDNLWMSCDEGLIRFNLKEKTFLQFSREDGLQDNEFNRGAHFRGNSGRLYFGGVKGLNVFKPQNVIDLVNKKKPSIVLLDLFINRKKVEVLPKSILTQSLNNIDTLKVNRRINALKVSFTALNYLFPKKNKFRYYLTIFPKGNKKKKIVERYLTDNNYTINFDLDNGTYLLHIQGSNNDSYWNEKGKKIVIVINYVDFNTTIGKFKSIFKRNPITSSLIGVLVAYIIGLSALLIVATKRGSNIFSRNWLFSLASYPLKVTPGMLSKILFIGYKQRLLQSNELTSLPFYYYGLSVTLENQEIVEQNSEGKKIIEIILNNLKDKKALFVIGGGGSGKSTLVAKITKSLIDESDTVSYFKDCIPILITPNMYNGDLIKTVKLVLEQKFRLNITEEALRGQFESKKFVLLLDGISELNFKSELIFKDLSNVTQNVNYKNVYFIFTSRNIPPTSFEAYTMKLESLDIEKIPQLLHKLDFTSAQKGNVLNQIEKLVAFDNLSPLLLSMIVSQNHRLENSQTESEIFENYFKTLLKIQSEEEWKGWKYALNYIAYLFLIKPNRRSVGLNRKELIDNLNQIVKERPDNSLLFDLKLYYDLEFASINTLIKSLKRAYILTEVNHNIKFAHDVFEEYFAAGFLFYPHNTLASFTTNWVNLYANNTNYERVFYFYKQMKSTER